MRHAWVEAYIPADRLPTGAVREDGIFDWSQGAWLRLDPTPSYSTAPTGMARQVEDWLSLLHSFWRDHVLSMSSARQREALYQPLIVQVRRAAADLSDPDGWAAADAEPLLGLGFWIFGAVVFGGVLVAGVWLLCVQWRAWRAGTRGTRRGGPAAAASNGRTSVAFYSRFETLLARCGHVRTASQTPREFATAAAQRIGTACGDSRISEWARQIIQAFYEVRFGAGTLADDQAAAVEAALQRLQQAARGQRPKTP